GKLHLSYHQQPVGEIDMKFLHDGRPAVVRQAIMPRSVGQDSDPDRSAVVKVSGVKSAGPGHFTDDLLKILASYNVCSKEWIIPHYDQEVRGRSVVKPLAGVKDDGPSDAAVVMPVLGSWTGLAIGCGLNPCYGDLDPYRMAAVAIDEAVRNVVAVGADPARI